MADTYTQTLKARRMEEDAYPEEWADRLNADVVDIFDAGISGQVEIDIGSATTYTLGALQNGTLSETHYWRLNFVGTPASAVTITVHASVGPNKEYLIDNQTGQALTIKYAATAGITVPDGGVLRVQCNGTTVSTDAYEHGDVRAYGASQGTANSSAAFTAAQTAVGTGGTIIVIGTYRITEIDLLSDRKWDLRGAIIESFDPETYIFRANSTDNIDIIGGLIDGRRGSATTAGNFEFGFWLRGCNGVRFTGTRVKDCYEDGVYVGNDDSSNQCIDIHFYDVDIGNSGRNNLSIVHADGVRGTLTVHNAQDSTAHYAGPWAGVDIEPNSSQWVDNIDLDIKSFDNDGNGVAIYGLAGLTTGKSRISIRHVSEGDNRGLRFGRWPDRSAGNELLFKYDGVIRDSQANESLYIDTIGGSVSADIKAQVYVSDNTKFLMTHLKESPGGTYANTPRLRFDIQAIGTIDDLFTNSSMTQIMSADTIIKIDASSLAVSAVGGTDSFAGRLEVMTTAINPFENARTATANVTPANVAMGERVNTNTGAGGAIVLTLQNGNFSTDQEAEFYVTVAQSVTVAISDNTKKILGYNDYEIVTNVIGSRIRLKKMSTGDWRVVPSPRGQALNWAATP